MAAQKRKRGRVARVFEHASHQILKDADCHPLEEMVKQLEFCEPGPETIAALDKIAKYFYPPLKATEMKVQTSDEIVIKLADAAHSN